MSDTATVEQNLYDTMNNACWSFSHSIFFKINANQVAMLLMLYVK